LELFQLGVAGGGGGGGGSHLEEPSWDESDLDNPLPSAAIDPSSAAVTIGGQRQRRRPAASAASLVAAASVDADEDSEVEAVASPALAECDYLSRHHKYL